MSSSSSTWKIPQLLMSIGLHSFVVQRAKSEQFSLFIWLYNHLVRHHKHTRRSLYKNSNCINAFIRNRYKTQLRQRFFFLVPLLLPFKCDCFFSLKGGNDWNSPDHSFFFFWKSNGIIDKIPSLSLSSLRQFFPPLFVVIKTPVNDCVSYVSRLCFPSFGMCLPYFVFVYSKEICFSSVVSDEEKL